MNRHGRAAFFENAIMHILWCHIGLVAAYDLFRCMVDGEAFLETEINPLVIAVYSLLDNSLVLFCVAKFDHYQNPYMD